MERKRARTLYNYFFSDRNEQHLSTLSFDTLVQVCKRHLSVARVENESPPTWDPDELADAVFTCCHV